MPQLSYSLEMPIANAGMIADMVFHTIESFQAYEAIGLGLGVVKRKGYDQVARLPKKNKITLVFSADLITGNKINMNVNGVAMAEVLFGTDHITTMNHIITHLENMTTLVADASLDTTDATNRTLLIRMVDGLNGAVTGEVVTEGSTQATITDTYSSWDTIDGISVSTMAIEQDSNGVVEYNNGYCFPSMRKGRVYVVPEVNVASGDLVYCRFDADGTTTFEGHFRNTSDSGKAVLVPYAVFKTTALAGGFAVIEINLP
jgi:hypothetical protein